MVLLQSPIQSALVKPHRARKISVILDPDPNPDLEALDRAYAMVFEPQRMRLDKFCQDAKVQDTARSNIHNRWKDVSRKD